MIEKLRRSLDSGTERGNPAENKVPECKEVTVLGKMGMVLYAAKWSRSV